MLPIHEVMTLKPVTVTRHTTIGDLMAEFDRHDYNAVPVVDRHGRLEGVVTKLDVLRAARPAPALELRSVRSVAEAPVENIMRRSVVTVEPEDSVATAVDLMIETRLRSLPVVRWSPGAGPMLVGIVSQGDLLRGLRFAFANEGIATELAI